LNRTTGGCWTGIVSSLETEARIAAVTHDAIGVGVVSGKKSWRRARPGLIPLLDFMPAIIEVRKGVKP
jgi:hypothetical protein